MWARLRNRLRFLFRRDRFDRELTEEMDFHREMLELEKTRQGLDREAAAPEEEAQLVAETRPHGQAPSMTAAIAPVMRSKPWAS